MKHILESFTKETLFRATVYLLEALNIKFVPETADPINVTEFYDGPMPLYLNEALASIENTYFIGIVNDSSLAGVRPTEGFSATIQHAGRYDGLFVFACDAKPGINLSRSTVSALTRAFNRISYANPVILVIRNNDTISLSTCERMDYTQEWRQEFGEKLGKVSMLRNINCKTPHRGHLDVLASLGSKAYSTFEELYKYWLEVFSSELLTKKFYNELFNWYEWAVKVIRFPNSLTDTADDEKYNHEAVIRLVTRLIFVWFLKQKHLIPDEFFDQGYIADNLLKDFNPNLKTGLFGEKSLESKYYKAILQNLFFAMLNCPITKEGESELSERYFSSGSSDDDDNKKLMHYESMFKNPELFIELANNTVPFLNGGLFDCLDNKDNDNYLDAFSDRDEIKKSLIVPDYLFFGEENGKEIDLSELYGVKNKRKVSAQGIIDILRHYNFTVEENTPYEQEVSLDPELLGNVFENLLASYNPETQTTAREETGSFYTPRDIVQYMVDESLVAHLMHTVGEELEPEFRKLVSYSDDKCLLTDIQKTKVMESIYHCKVLDPACGSGAFPVGMLQQMVHILSKLDPTNEQWKEMMRNNAISETSVAYRTATDDERKEMLADIERNFDEGVNRPDYARKLYLIENCIYGVDIQPIAIQISKLRFFISLVVDQKTNNKPEDNFGIRPLPNLEAKFVAANSLIPLAKLKANIGRTDEIVALETKLKEANHKIFSAKTVRTKRKWKERLVELRTEMASKLVDNGFLDADAINQMTSWNMFDQNAAASFFDADWMFGIKDGFDIVIANPPFIDSERMTKLGQTELRKFIVDTYKYVKGNWDIYMAFLEMGLTHSKNCMAYITPDKWLSKSFGSKFREKCMIPRLYKILHTGSKTFNSATVDAIVTLFIDSSTSISAYKFEKGSIMHMNTAKSTTIAKPYYIDSLFNKNNYLISKIEDNATPLSTYAICENACATSDAYALSPFVKNMTNTYSSVSEFKLVNTGTIDKFFNKWGCKEITYLGDKYLHPVVNKQSFISNFGKSYVRRSIAKKCIFKGLNLLDGFIDFDGDYLPGKSTLVVYADDTNHLKYICGILNSKLAMFYIKSKYSSSSYCGGITFSKEMINGFPIPYNESSYSAITSITDEIINNGNLTESLNRRLNMAVYVMYGLSYDEVLIVDSNTSITREEYDNFKLDN